MGKEDKLAETLEEAARVRADFGYPIMVTPLSQFVVSQAAINVIVGERYKEVTDQVIQYALGIWGKEATEMMDANVKDKILGRSRAKDWQGWTPPDLSLHASPAKIRRDCFRRRTLVPRLCRPRCGQRAADQRRAQAATRRQTIAVATDRATQQEEKLQSYLRQARRRFADAWQVNQFRKPGVRKSFRRSGGFQPPLFCDLCG